jgi:hypothetical protein
MGFWNTQGGALEAPGNKAPDDNRKCSHPNHPTMTVIAGTGANRIKLSNFMQYCPSTEEKPKWK